MSDKFCSRCGTAMDAEAEFCTNCGQPVQSTLVQMAPPPPQQHVVTSAVQPPQQYDVISPARPDANKTRRRVKVLPIVCICAVLSVLLVIFVPRVVADPKGTKIPSGVPYESIVETIAPDIEKLSPEERDLLDKWLKSHTVTMSQVAKARNPQTSDLALTQLGAQVGGSMGGFAGLFGGLLGAAVGAEADIKRAERQKKWSESVEEQLANGVPMGMTIGKAIEEQWRHEEEQRQKILKAEALKAKQEMEKQAAIDAMRQALAVKIDSKKLVTKRDSWGSVDEYTETVFRYLNNTKKDIAGFKGVLSVVDQFGDKIASFPIKFDLRIGHTMKAGEARKDSIKNDINSYNRNDPMRRFASMDLDLCEEIWEPAMIVFADGSELKAEADAELKEIFIEMRSAVTVKVLSRKKVTKSYSPFLEMMLTYKNNTEKDITGFKSFLRITDQFGDVITHFELQNDHTIKAGETIKLSEIKPWEYSKKLDSFATDEALRFKEVWVPTLIVFSDGSILDLDGKKAVPLKETVQAKEVGEAKPVEVAKKTEEVQKAAMPKSNAAAKKAAEDARRTEKIQKDIDEINKIYEEMKKAEEAKKSEGAKKT